MRDDPDQYGELAGLLVKHGDYPLHEQIARELRFAYKAGYRRGREDAEHSRVCEDPSDCTRCLRLDADRRR